MAYKETLQTSYHVSERQEVEVEVVVGTGRELTFSVRELRMTTVYLILI